MRSKNFISTNKAKFWFRCNLLAFSFAVPFLVYFNTHPMIYIGSYILIFSLYFLPDKKSKQEKVATFFSLYCEFLNEGHSSKDIIQELQLIKQNHEKEFDKENTNNHVTKH